MNELETESWKSYRNHAHYCLEHCVSILKLRYFQLLAQWIPKQQGQEMQFETVCLFYYLCLFMFIHVCFVYVCYLFIVLFYIHMFSFIYLDFILFTYKL